MNAHILEIENFQCKTNYSSSLDRERTITELPSSAIFFLCAAVISVYALHKFYLLILTKYKDIWLFFIALNKWSLRYAFYTRKLSSSISKYAHFKPRHKQAKKHQSFYSNQTSKYTIHSLNPQNKKHKDIVNIEHKRKCVAIEIYEITKYNILIQNIIKNCKMDNLNICLLIERLQLYENNLSNKKTVVNLDKKNIINNNIKNNFEYNSTENKTNEKVSIPNLVNKAKLPKNFHHYKEIQSSMNTPQPPSTGKFLINTSAKASKRAVSNSEQYEQNKSIKISISDSSSYREKTNINYNPNSKQVDQSDRSDETPSQDVLRDLGLSIEDYSKLSKTKKNYIIRGEISQQFNTTPRLSDDELDLINMSEDEFNSLKRWAKVDVHCQILSIQKICQPAPAQTPINAPNQLSKITEGNKQAEQTNTSNESLSQTSIKEAENTIPKKTQKKTIYGDDYTSPTFSSNNNAFDSILSTYHKSEKEKNAYNNLMTNFDKSQNIDLLCLDTFNFNKKNSSESMKFASTENEKAAVEPRNSPFMDTYFKYDSIQPNQNFNWSLNHEVNHNKLNTFLSVKNLALEEKYPRPQHLPFTLELRGSCFETFDKCIYKRNAEIFKYKGVKDPKRCELVEDKETKENYIIIQVSALEEYIELVKPWPPTSFGSSLQAPLRVDPQPIDLQLTISNYSSERTIDSTNRSIREIDRLYGITKVSRPSGQPDVNKIWVKCRTLYNFVTNCNTGIQLDPSHHIPKINYQYIKPCQTCWSISHRECTTTRLCGNCSDTDHREEDCVKPPYCITCRLSGHCSSSELCTQLCDRLYEKNAYIISTRSVKV